MLSGAVMKSAWRSIGIGILLAVGCTGSVFVTAAKPETPADQQTSGAGTQTPAKTEPATAQTQTTAPAKDAAAEKPAAAAVPGESPSDEAESADNDLSFPADI